jgi:hypothetical protein
MDERTASELEATVAARRELGPSHDRELIEGFLDRIDHEIQQRVDERVAKRAPRRPAFAKEELGIAVPLVIVAGIFGGVWGIAAVCAALVIVFVTLALAHR